jgi:hypothetical protein
LPAIRALPALRHPLAAGSGPGGSQAPSTSADGAGGARAGRRRRRAPNDRPRAPAAALAAGRRRGAAMAHSAQAAAGGVGGGGEPELAGARPITSIAHVVEAVAHRVQSQFAQLIGDMPASAPEARRVEGGSRMRLARLRVADSMGCQRAHARGSSSGTPGAGAALQHPRHGRRAAAAPSPSTRPQQLLGFLHGARQQLLRLGALLHDPRKLAVAQRAAEQGSALDVAAGHARALQAAADELFKANMDLRFNRVPLLNVHDAVDVLGSGAGGAGGRRGAAVRATGPGPARRAGSPRAARRPAGPCSAAAAALVAARGRARAHAGL